MSQYIAHAQKLEVAKYISKMIKSDLMLLHRFEFSGELSILQNISWSRINLKFQLDSPFLWWASIHSTWRHCPNWFSFGSGYVVHFLLFNLYFLCFDPLRGELYFRNTYI